ncbi:HAD-like protein [Coemansia reversa NRRL 1564]|uniref:HAD-like protein n=1 Tax=Coemansia reversa (strain ATCC 12441 / NRRL 1564) TaxID=763665 RepID=A0A2G5B1F6_COERN|nr:HAD-like protein [Coemansia reversa NRRL 1564]|eukprot:PIA12842.1 HAD-like protein [Coemansia reversa NRRL 1564]
MTSELLVEGVIFDLDGTLLNTLLVAERVYTEEALKYNLDPKPILEYLHGVPTLKVLQKYYPSSTHTLEYSKAMELECAKDLDGISVIPGTFELLASIPIGKWSVFTSGMPQLALPRLKYLGITVPPVFITPEDIINGKPHPEGYVLAAKKMGLQANKCLVFEDAAAGIIAGCSAGAVVVGVRTLLSAKELRDAGALYTVKDMTKVKASLNENGLLITIDES